MSPSSAGVKSTPNNNVSVERYIGSYLIQTTTARPKHHIQKVNKNYNYPNHNNNHHDVIKPKDTNNCRYMTISGSHNENWIETTPIYSYSCRGNVRKCHQQQQQMSSSSPPTRNEKFHPHTQLSRLAIHTQGIPLILTGRTNNNSSRKTNNNYSQKCNNYIDMSGARFNIPSTDSAKVNKSDNNSVSVATDTLSVASDESSSSNNSENCLPRIIKPRKRRKKDRKPQQPPPPQSISSSPQSPPSTPQAKTNETIMNNKQTTSLLSSDISSDIPNLNHDFDDVQELTNQQNHCSPTSCQCKLCDPCGQIWNIDTTFLTNVKSIFSNSMSTVDKIVPTTLRRSWSDPMPDYHYRVSSNNTDVGVIGSGRYASSNLLNNVTQNKNQHQLNISTEIVTSPNGHRDLEIKFLSFSPTQNTKYLPNDPILSSDEKDYGLSYDITQINQLLLTIEE